MELIECSQCDDIEEWNSELMDDDNFTSGLSSWKKNIKHYSRKVQRGSGKQNTHAHYSRRNCPCCSASKHVGRSLHHTNKPLKHEAGSFLSYIPDEFYESTMSVPRIVRIDRNEIVSCSICYDTINIKDRENRRCGHIFHKSCMEKWRRECFFNFDKQASCPLCRKV